MAYWIHAMMPYSGYILIALVLLVIGAPGSNDDQPKD